MSSLRSFTRYEKFGNTIFPVTYTENGFILVDYPNEPLGNTPVDLKRVEELNDVVRKLIKDANLTFKLGPDKETTDE